VGKGERERAYRTSQRRPSVAVCFPVLSSFRTKDCRSSDSRGAASCLSLIFCRRISFILGVCVAGTTQD
jgi:hypothetical protein